MIYHIQDVAWNKIYEFLCLCKGIHKAEAPLRRFIEAIWFIGRSGCQWRLLPYYYGNWRTVHKRFLSWIKRGIWTNLFEYIKKEPDTELFMMDATIV